MCGLVINTMSLKRLAGSQDVSACNQRVNFVFVKLVVHYYFDSGIDPF